MDTDHVDWLGRHIEDVGAPVVHLFGGPYVTVGTERREVPEGSKLLLAFVALRRRRVERRKAAGTLWPCGDEGRAAGNLRSALWRLRRAGIDVLAADKWSLALSADVLVDLHVMDQWVTRLIDGTASGDDLAVSPSWADALDLLPGWYDDWVVLEQERWDQLRLYALEAAAEALLCCGQHMLALEASLVAARSELFRESAHRVIIRVYLAEGNWGAAMQHYQDYQRILRRELNLAPTTAMDELMHPLITSQTR